MFSQQIIAENLAKAYAFYKNWNEAGEICKTLVSLNTSDLQAVEMYARTLAMSGKIPESKAQYERALELAQQQNDEAIVTRVCTASFSRDLCQFLRLVIVLFVKEICRQKARLHYGGFKWYVCQEKEFGSDKFLSVNAFPSQFLSVPYQTIYPCSDHLYR